MHKAKTEFDLLLEQLPLVDKPPNESWLKYSVFAKRAGANAVLVKEAFKHDVIDHKHCVAIPSAKGAVLRLLIDWNAAGYDYILSRQKKYWPDDFKKNKKQQYKPIEVTHEAKIKTSKKAKNKVKEATEELAHIDTLQEAKLETEKLRILNLRVENQLANNEVIKVEDALEIAQSVAHATKSQLRRFVTVVAPDLLRCNNVVEIRTTLEQALEETFKELEPLILESTYKEGFDE